MCIINELSEVLPEFLDSVGPSLLEIRVNRGAHPKVGRPNESPLHIKLQFMKALGISNE